MLLLGGALFAVVCVLTDSLLLFSVEMSGHDMVCFDKTFEAAEALLHMESPGGLHNERNTGKHSVLPPCVDNHRNLCVEWIKNCEWTCYLCMTDGK